MTGEVTSERLSLTVFSPVDASRRASEIELPGIHSAGLLAEVAGPRADEPVDHLIGIGGLHPDLDALVADGCRGLVVLVGQRRDLIGDRRVDDHGDGDLAGHASGGAGLGALRQRVAEEAPQR